MSWAQWHSQSEALAMEAELASRAGDSAKARQRYSEAAEAEHSALLELDPAKTRTLGITAVSAASLWFKAGELEKAERLACLMMSGPELPEFATDQLRRLIQAVWTELSKRDAPVQFLPGQVLFSVRGGEVVSGGAPLDLIVDKVQTIQAIFHRSLEEAQDKPLRTRGGAPREVQEACRPWLFQEPPGSYQFSVAIQELAQGDLFKAVVDPARIAERFLSILRAAVSPDPAQLESLVPKPEYQSAFLKLARNLAPSGKMFEQLEIRSALDANPLLLRPEDRKAIGSNLRRLKPKQEKDLEQKEVALKGVLRAVDLDKDWIEVSIDSVSHHITGLAEALDDVIGPMVNRKVIVRVLQGTKQGYTFEDIELDE